MNEYKIIDVMKLKGKSVVAVDRKIDLSDVGTNYLIIDGKMYFFTLSHAPFSLIIDTQEDILGKTVVFLKEEKS